MSEDELPEGWAEARLEELIGADGTFTDGDWVESKDQDPSGNVRLIQLADVGDGEFRDRSQRFLTSDKAAQLGCTFLQSADILVARMPEPLGRACVFPGVSQPSVTVVDVCVVRPGPSAVSPSWLVHAINAPIFRGSMEAFERGTTRKRISRSNLAALAVPVPPLAEQRRIVEKVEALLAEVNAARARLAKAPVILKRFRQSILSAACSGRLTEDWRDRVDDASDQEESGELPRSWIQRTVEQLASKEPRSIQSGPFGSSLLHSEFTDRGVLVVGIDNVLDGAFSMGKQHRISREKFRQLEKFAARPLDVLVTVMATVGRCCVVPAILETAIITKHVYRITCDQSAVSPQFLLCCLRGDPSVRIQIGEQVRGQTRPGINGEILKSLLVPVPPLPEQHEIVRRVDSLFRLADAIEARVAAATARADKLTQAILAKAFRGELVPTEAELARQEGRDYEPASALLARIRAERAASEAKPSQGRTGRHAASRVSSRGNRAHQ